MDFKQLKHFMAVVEQSSFRKAADTLNISQPALSISIKKLEIMLGCILLDRASGKVIPTAFGRSLYQSARTIKKDLKHAQDRLNEIHGMTKGRVTVGISPYAYTPELGQFIGVFVNKYPGLELRTILETYDSVVPSLINEKMDFGIVEVAERNKHPRIGHKTLYRNPYVLIARPNHPLASKNILEPKDIVEFPWIYGTNMIAHVKNWAETFTESGLTPPEPVVAGGSIQFYESLMHSSNFLAALPLAFIKERIAQGVFIELKIPGADWFNYMDILYRDDLTMSPGARRLFDDILAGISDA